MRKLAEVCIARPVFASMLILALVVVGATSYFKLGIDRFPSVDLPTIMVSTSLPGASPEEVEAEVTQRIEEVVNSVDGIDELRSISASGQSQVIATFRLDRDIDAAAQDVRDRVAGVIRNLPAEAEPPVTSKFDNDSRPVITIAISGERSVRELTELADKLVKVQLQRVKGVGEVSIVGQLQRSISIWVDAGKLAAYQIPITAVREAIANQNIEIPGGRVTEAAFESQLRTLGRIVDPEKFGEVTLSIVNGAPVRVKDVAKVEDGTKEQRSVARLNGVPTVKLEVRRQSGANTIEVIEGVKKELAIVEPQMPTGVKLEVIEDQSRYIYAALHEIDTHLVLGSILACLVVLAFMRSLRAVIIAGIAIPASVISTFGMMWAMNFTLNSVTMLALVLMVGIVIDDAIVVLENIFRFIEEKKMTPMEAAREGTSEIALAVLATTLSLVVIFVPVSFMSSISGRFLYQFGMTAAVAVLISLLVSFTLTPMLAARMLHPSAAGQDHAVKSRGGFYAYIDSFYTYMLKLVMRHRFTTALTAALVMASAIPLYKVVKQDYLPTGVDEGEFTVKVTAREGTSFAAIDEVMRRIEADLFKVPEIRTVLASAGGGWLGTVNTGRVYVRIAPHEERYFSIGRLWHETMRGTPLAAFRGNYSQADVMKKIRGMMRKYKDLDIAVRDQPSFNISGGNSDISFIIRGPELNELARYTEELRLMTTDGRLPGIIEADTSLKMDSPEVRVEVDRRRAEDLGVNMRDLGTALRLLVGGDQQISRYRDPQTNESYDVQIRLAEKDRNSPATLDTLLLPRKSGAGPLVELRNVASVSSGTAPARIDRLNRQRAATLDASISGNYALADRLIALNEAADSLNMPPAYSATVAGRGRELERTFVEFVWAFGLSMVFMYIILAANYESVVHPMTILLSIPLSIPFAMLSLWISGGTLNLYSALGMLVLFGVVKKNAILQIDHTNQLRARGMDRYAAIIQANRERLRPILMTTMSLVAGMLPLALGTGPGAQERKAVALVVIGGQTLCLLVTLLVTPVAYSLMDDLGNVLRRRKAEHEQPQLEESLPSREHL